MARDHGGNIDEAVARFGAGDWIDLSTGINRRPWPVGQLPDHVWRSLPTQAAQNRLIRVASDWLCCDPNRLLPVAGASAAIQLIPRLLAPGRACVIAPSYNEHAASLRAAGWQVDERADLHDMEGADLAVVVNPNNPDGREWPPHRLRALARTVGHLIIDESFADPRPDLSLATDPADNMLILRSFGKFWGLAGLRLGFTIAHPDWITRLSEAAGPWPVNGPALDIATTAMADRDWADDTIVYHAEAGLRLDRLALATGWTPAGGTHLFRLYATPGAHNAQTQLARAHIWTRRFPYSTSWLRLGIPGTRSEWDRLTAAPRTPAARTP